MQINDNPLRITLITVGAVIVLGFAFACGIQLGTQTAQQPTRTAIEPVPEVTTEITIPAETSYEPTGEPMDDIEEIQVITAGPEETLVLGDMEYKLETTEWRSSLDGREPDSKFLTVWLDVNNQGTAPERVADFSLFDSEGIQYVKSKHDGLFAENFGSERINPGVKKNGFVVFDVPQTKKYTLEIKYGDIVGHIPL